MKKITPYIFLFIIFVNLFAPFTSDFRNKKIVKLSSVEAAPTDPWWYLAIIDKKSVWKKTTASTNEECRKFAETQADASRTLRAATDFLPAGYVYPDCIQRIEKEIEDLTKNTTKKFYYSISNTGYSDGFDSEDLCKEALAAAIKAKTAPETTQLGIVTNKCEEKRISDVAWANQKISDNDENPTGMPACSITSTWITGAGSFTGCLAQAIYYILFVPVSWVFALSGQFFDKVFEYSLDNASYDVAFVTNGWGVVRDFCNMFFIFVLLYIAIATILDLNHFKTKEMIINVIIIGVLINFSMLATHVMIDASNILARVFYNSDTIKITSKTSNLMFDDSKDGTIPLSMALVNKFDPQALVLQGHKHMDTNSYKTTGGTNTEVAVPDENSEIGTGTFIIITLMSTIMSVFGIIMFMSVGLIFVARVIALWFAIIFSPLAFFSYMVPQLSGMKMFGWKNWWPETLKLCFLAPIFMFFLYLIIAFLDQAMSLGDLDSAKGMRWWILITVPFIFIIMLMSKAKEIAKEYSGSLGQSITNGLAAAGGLALGGGAAMIALGGRNIIGRGTAALSRNATEKDKKIDNAAKLEHNESLSTWELKDKNHKDDMSNWSARKAKADSKAGTSSYIEFTEAMPEATHGEKPGEFKAPEKPFSVGRWLNNKEKDVAHTIHEQREFDALKKEAHIPDNLADWQIDGEQEGTLEKIYGKKKKAEFEADIRKNGAGDLSNQAVYERDARAKKIGTRTLDSAELKKIDDEIKVEFNVKVQKALDDKLGIEYSKLRAGAAHGPGVINSMIAGSNSHSYDARNISQMSPNKNDAWYSKSSLALTAGIALAIRQGFKSSGVNNQGKGGGDFTKDIGNIITDALKNVKIEVPKAPSGGGDSHGGGDHGHH